MKRLSLPVLLAVTLAVGVSLAYAGGPRAWKQPTWKNAKQQTDVISAVNASAGTISIHHKGGSVKIDHNLKTNAFTEVVIDGQKSSVSSLRTGMRVSYTLGMDGDTLARIENVATVQVAPTPVATATPSFPKKR